MNEQLQKEIIAILQGMREGASPAWQTLVEQRADYALAYFISVLIMAILVAVLSYILFRTGKKLEAEAGSGDDGYIACFVTSVLMAVISIGCTIASITWIPTAIAPLGQVLNVLNR